MEELKVTHVGLSDQKNANQFLSPNIAEHQHFSCDEDSERENDFRGSEIESVYLDQPQVIFRR